MPQKDGCIDCHGGSDYHHAKLQDYTVCDVGEVGSDDFGVKNDVCPMPSPGWRVWSQANPWAGGRTEFYLSYHDGDPPANISFPAESAGSGYDKSKFLSSTDVMSGHDCSSCHNSNGSSYPSLLKDLHHH